MRCVLHPDTETGLRCGKCEQPICPRCLIQTPVGARCPKCAAVKRLPVYQITAAFYARAVAAGFSSSAILGAIWAFMPFNYLSLFIALIIGYSIGELVSLSVNRKYGAGLQTIAAVSVLISYLIRTLLDTNFNDFLGSFLDVYGLIAVALGIVVATSRLRSN